MNMQYKRIALLSAVLLTLHSTVHATTANSAAVAELMNIYNIIFGFAILLLLVAVHVLSKSVVGLSKIVSVKKKVTAIVLLTVLTHLPALAQNTGDAANRQAKLPDLLFHSETYLLAMLILVLAITLFVLLKINLKLIKSVSPVAEKVKPVAVAETVVQKAPSLFRRIYLRMIDNVPISQEKDILLDHDYDGIQELDNNMPPWWKYGFYVTILFGIGYLLHYHVSKTGNLQEAEYQQELYTAALQQEERMKLLADNVNETNVTAVNDPKLLAEGKEVFVKNCSACHRNDGGGQVGPNLTDEYWIQGGGITNIFKTIVHGVPAKGMISWKSQLSPKQIQHVASYILTLKGTRPEGGKEPQGELWVEEVPAPSDTISSAVSDSLIAQKGERN
jgi:cytochrome c oxidase cbb3-type subunit 3